MPGYIAKAGPAISEVYFELAAARVFESLTRAFLRRLFEGNAWELGCIATSINMANIRVLVGGVDLLRDFGGFYFRA